MNLYVWSTENTEEVITCYNTTPFDRGSEFKRYPKPGSKPAALWFHHSKTGSAWAQDSWWLMLLHVSTTIVGNCFITTPKHRKAGQPGKMRWIFMKISSNYVHILPSLKHKKIGIAAVTSGSGFQAMPPITQWWYHEPNSNTWVRLKI